MWWIFRFFRRSLTNPAPPRFPSSHKRPQADYSKAYKKNALNGPEVKKQIGQLPEARVLRVLDGDTVIVMMDRSETVVRLDSIDCPEDGQAWAGPAAAELRTLIDGRIVGLEQHGQDPYGRTLATIYVWNSSENGCINVNERMVVLGHAWVMRLYYDHLPRDRQQKLNQLEKWAKLNQLGLWKDPNPVPPWKWRKVNRSLG
jgi:micrococcal nuclease